MANINYKEYLSQLGKIETDAKARIKQYLEEQIKQDSALENLYRPEKIDDCYNFIKNVVKEMPHSGNSAAVEDAIVFKMARDYFIEILPKEADEPPKVKEAGAETATEVETAAETEPGKEQADNENAGTPCEETESENEKPANDDVMLNQADKEGGEESYEEVNGAAETEPEEKNQADNENKTVTDSYGFEIFGEKPESISETGAETATEAETAAETEPEKEQADNENAGTPCEETESENKKPVRKLVSYDPTQQPSLFDF